VGPHCSFCGTFTGPFSEIEGLFTVLICIPCLEVLQAKPDTPNIEVIRGATPLERYWAIEFQRALRTRAGLTSVLEEIPGWQHIGDEA